MFHFLYKVFDEFIYALDPHASKARVSPKWFMFLVSFYGLGFQLLLMAFFWCWEGLIISSPFSLDIQF